MTEDILNDEGDKGTLFAKPTTAAADGPVVETSTDATAATPSPTATADPVKPVRSITISDVQREGVWPERFKIVIDSQPYFVKDLPAAIDVIKTVWGE